MHVKEALWCAFHLFSYLCLPVPVAGKIRILLNPLHIASGVRDISGWGPWEMCVAAKSNCRQQLKGKLWSHSFLL